MGDLNEPTEEAQEMASLEMQSRLLRMEATLFDYRKKKIEFTMKSREMDEQIPITQSAIDKLKNEIKELEE